MDNLFLIGIDELALILGYSRHIIRQKKIPLPPLYSCSRTRWRMGDVRKFIAQGGQVSVEVAESISKRKAGRPTKASQIILREKNS